MSERENCWLCKNGAAASGEHRLKKTTVKTVMDGNWSDICFQSNVDDKLLPVQGPGSKLLKYPGGLCESCNNVSTQPFDIAYTRLFDYLDKRFTSIIVQPSTIHTCCVFKEDQELNCYNVFRYYLKSFGCELYDRGQPVPSQIRKAVQGEVIPSDFDLYLFIGNKARLLEKRMGPGGCLEITPPVAALMRYKNPIKGKKIRKWDKNSRYIHINPLPEEHDG